MSDLSVVTTPLLIPKRRYSLPDNLIKETGSLLEDFEDFTDWTVNHGSAADDAVNYKTGTQSVEVTTDVGGEGEIQNQGLSWEGIGNKEVRVWCYIPDASAFTAGSMKIQLYDERGLGVRKEMLPYFFDGWNLIHIGPDDWTIQGVGTLDDAITRIRFRINAVAGQPTISWDSFYMQQISEPAVVFTFDNAKDNIYDTAFPIMRARNMVATEYIVTDDIGGGGIMTWAELLELQDAGWVIANHSEDHTDFTTLTEAEIETNLTNAVTAMQANGITGNGPYHVAYPGGGWDADTLAAMADTNMLTGRTIDQARHPALPMDRPYEIHRLFDLDDGTSLATAKSYIDDIDANGKVAYIVGHNIEAVAAATAWAESDFIELCDYIAQKRIATLTIEDAYQVQSGPRMVRKAR